MTPHRGSDARGRNAPGKIKASKETLRAVGQCWRHSLLAEHVFACEWSLARYAFPWIEVGLTESLQQIAKFKDLLVHRYAEVDNTRVLKIVKHNLNDVREFERQIQKLIREESGAP